MEGKKDRTATEIATKKGIALIDGFLIMYFLNITTPVHDIASKMNRLTIQNCTHAHNLGCKVIDEKITYFALVLRKPCTQAVQLEF